MTHILLVEDDEDLSETLRDWLEFNEYGVECALTGFEAIEQLNFSSFDLIILDWQLPGINGIDVLKQYRESGGKSPILMLTGHTESKEIELLLSLGATAYMAKPFNLKDLSLKVAQIVSGSSNI